MLGIALGVAALIIVLSVMNGFQKEVRDRMLSVVSHLEVFSVDGSGLAHLQNLEQPLSRHPEVRAWAPFVAAQALLARGVGALVVTLGARGCRLYRAGHAPLAVAGHAVNVVDTVGAGDTFTGALAAALARGADWPQALTSANAAAALSTQGRGAVAAMPSLAQVQRWLAQG